MSDAGPPTDDSPPAGAERARLAADPGAWRRWGPYLSERAWGTVREDYSPDGTAWESFPHAQARSRVYRWSEDGIAGICDEQQRLCFALALWNGRDPIIKERLFGLTGNEGNHGEDVKECYWYLDSTPTHSWMRYRYHYPQVEFPYGRLLAENRARGRLDPEFELVDTGVFEGDRYWEVTIDYAKATADDIRVRISVRNAGPDEAQLDVVPTLWFRNTWAWTPAGVRPSLHATGTRIDAEHRGLGRFVLTGAEGGEPLVCDNENNSARLWGLVGVPPFAKDGINDHVVSGAATVNPALTGTKAALRYRLMVAGGGQATVHLRLAPAGAPRGDADDDVLRRRQDEADAFYREVSPESCTADVCGVLRQALSGMLWSKQFYHYDVERWLDGDLTQPEPPASRQQGRNHDWRHLNNHDVISMPDKWEYPWYAAWDLAFHCVALAHVDPEFAKSQLILLCREWFMHPNGQLPAYEWAFGDVNPPVHAWAALTVHAIDGGDDHEFLERVFHKLLINFTWWVNRKDVEGRNAFEGGFLGLDNIGPFDRSAMLPVQGRLIQSDATAWMAMYCLDMLKMALTLARRDRTYEDVATKFFEHFTYIASAMTDQGIWNEEDGFYNDVLHLPDGTRIPIRARSMVGLIPLLAVTTLDPVTLDALPAFEERFFWFIEHHPDFSLCVSHIHETRYNDNRLLSIVGPQRLRRILSRMLDPGEFLSDHGLRALSAYHRDHPLDMDLGGVHCRLDYEPGESTSGLFGGNSNWRGPIWMPLNHLLVSALQRFHHSLGDGYLVEFPTGSGTMLSLGDVAEQLCRRLIGIFSDDAQGRRPVFGSVELAQTDPRWHDLIPFHEYFHGDSGAGLGASHQTGWTGLIADMIIRRGLEHEPYFGPVGDLNPR